MSRARIELSESVLFQAMLSTVSGKLLRLPDGQQNTLVRLPFALSVPAESLWRKWGQWQKHTVRKDVAEVMVSPLIRMVIHTIRIERAQYGARRDRLYDQIMPREIHEHSMVAAHDAVVAALHSDSAAAADYSAGRLRLRDHPALYRLYYTTKNAATDWNRIFLLFEQRPAREQDMLVAEAAYLAAFATLLFTIFEDARAEIEREFDDPAERERVRATLGLSTDLTTQRFELDVLLTFLRIYFWEDDVTPLERVKIYLPPGMFPDGFQPLEEPAGGEPQLRGGMNDVAEDDQRIRTPRSDFYRSLGCRVFLEPGDLLRSRGYVAYPLRSAAGLRFIFVDTDQAGNAGYVFVAGRYGDDAQQLWAVDAAKHKWEIRYGNAPTFVTRFYHSEHWQRNVRRFLESH
ncbi:MAG: hypothetical protein U0136_13545 [Bdellovibrionota bacterium]